MLYGTPGWVTPEIAIVGRADMPLYVLINDEAATLVEGGLSGMTELVWRQINALMSDFGGIRHLRYWVITHSHYDHCSLLMTLKSRMPWLHVVGSPGTADALQSESACRTIVRLDAMASRAFAAPFDGALCPLADIPLHPIKAGNVLDIGAGMQLLAIALPGHSVCQSGYYCPQLDLLFASDALGEYQGPGRWLPLVFHDLAAYRHSLDVVEARHAARIALGHHGILAWEWARHAARQARSALDQFEEEARRTRADEHATLALARQWTERHSQPSASVVPADLHLKSMQRMIGLFHACRH
ncbi:MBL fold metallo-hydrolase [Trinickia diaoshuihuensis]|uniref:MBL fold metallo-hydrolase n=1 Tax=Trinickia diaoshuihuensis TaxID=2292265 RepID=UPI000E23E55A|nr:MBL fold metallo-hydrolase [Trinickia diaoshuihuensis]